MEKRWGKEKKGRYQEGEKRESIDAKKKKKW